MRWKKIETTEWRRVFVFWPKGTVDGFRVTLGYVWKRSVPIEDEYGLSLESRVVDEYHTNPDGLEDEYQKKRDSGVTQIQIGGNNSQSIQSDGDLYINGKKYESSGHVLTEGKTLHHPKRPPKREVSDKIQLPNRPPPPPAPPPIRIIKEDVNFKEIISWLDVNVDKLFDKRTEKRSEREEENEKMLQILKKRKHRRDAKKIVDKWPKWKKDFRLTKYSDL